MFRALNEQAYHVGGSVRDRLLGVPCHDRDFVISVSEERFAQVFPDAQRIGSSFPVYIIDSCETALTRSERSTGVGYTDFECNVGVTIEDDLGRRDFTINSIGMRYGIEPPVYVDPFGGIEDLKYGILRTINPTAFQDDPLRMARACRFLARFPHFRLDVNRHAIMTHF
jgi:tRNA nucleotidyltransferase (CCA-adding enzyme)